MVVFSERDGVDAPAVSLSRGDPMRDKLNCPNCGAPITGVECPYCGSVVTEFNIKVWNFCAIKESV